MKQLLKFYDWITVGAFMYLPMVGVNLFLFCCLYSAQVLYDLPLILFAISLIFLTLSVIGLIRIIYHYVIKKRKGKIQDKRKK